MLKISFRRFVAPTLFLLVIGLTSLCISTGIMLVQVQPALACGEVTQSEFISGNVYFHPSLRCPWEWGDDRTKDLGKFDKVFPEGIPKEAQHVEKKEDEDGGKYTVFYLEGFKLNGEKYESSGWLRIQH